MIVREATIDDSDSIIRLCSSIVEESKIIYPPISPDFLIYNLFSRGLNIKCFVTEENSIITGIIIGGLSRPIYSDKLFATHLIFFVDTNYRGSRAAYLLLKKYENWAISSGAKFIEMSVATGLTTDRTGKFYERLGYTFMGGKYRKDV